MSPEELVLHAHDAGVHTLALTDHDTVSGIDRAIEAGRRAGVEVIAGIELEVTVPEDDAVPGSCHILGLGLSRWHGPIEDHLEAIIHHREERNKGIIVRMQNAGIRVKYDEVKAYSPDGVVGRPHIARYMVDRDLAESELHAFRDYLGEFGSYYVPREVMELQDALDVIHEAGGLAVLAHPYTLFLSWSGLIDRTTKWSRMGLDGIEAYHSNVRYKDAKRIASLASELGMVVSAGSDFHGLQRRDRKIGRSSDGRKIEDSFAAPFLNRRGDL